MKAIWAYLEKFWSMAVWAVGFAALQLGFSEFSSNLLQSKSTSFTSALGQGASWSLPDFSSVLDWLHMADTFFPVHESFGMIVGLASTWAGCIAWKKLCTALGWSKLGMPKGGGYA